MGDGPLSPVFRRARPEGDTHERDVCERCGFVSYENPRIVVGSVVVHEGRYLLGRRAIEPSRGLWTLPAGYLELHETPEDGARREAREELCAEIELDGLLAVYTIARLSQVQMIYRARFDGRFAAGSETLEAGLFDWAEIPWREIAFPSVHWALNHMREVDAGRAAAPLANPPGETGAMSR
ncbi:NUDIX hydrolase [Stappia stellulata]|uniref:NUDIX hydrolase n=1 Tax=Stappia stellulata TaxID=71235 RepID=UPI000407270E|nr:NUDIX hydrolase [Stappia stellulata]